ncbi:hypothetical protein SARC_03968 [Sphaeroforma arctica JP610]|uniref:DNA-directed DNA polymerase n=1 Tax=Sphaeroforma arctica JP610 TaxID=667725 RepID=A0A0L0G3V7_9EUKA|nr:hypothetical protein SARC_03968 [Sphaeroforma arctica JP610]KNC83792.1 hypothetical protein SARC_03968 [Sphaeroforma arctica JP610]|eukprot:XP_014157694.1 hypothetical protein SARC_03968 [Sphaeroforma arctica JP610]
MVKGLTKRTTALVMRDIFMNMVIKIFKKVPYTSLVEDLAGQIRHISHNTMRIPPLSFCKSVQVKDAKHYKIRPLSENPVLLTKRLRDLDLPESTTEECEAYKRTCLPGHILASVKMMERGQQIRAGDRIAVLVVRGAPKQRQQDRIVDLDYFQESRKNPELPQFSIDTDYYINSIVNPLADIFSTVYKVDKAMVKEVSIKRGTCPTLHKTPEDKANAVVGKDGRTRVLTQSTLQF